MNIYGYIMLVNSKANNHNNDTGVLKPSSECLFNTIGCMIKTTEKTKRIRES